MKKKKKKKKKYGNTYFLMQASDYIIHFLNKNKFFVALSTNCDTFLHINK